MNDREKFEEICKTDFRAKEINENYFGLLLKFVNGKYAQHHIQAKWEGYQAAHAESTARIAELEQRLPPIERDEDMDRTYIPLPAGWEIQTKGKGSTFRIAKTDDSGERWPVLEEKLHEPLERMAREIHQAITNTGDNQ